MTIWLVGGPKDGQQFDVTEPMRYFTTLDAGITEDGLAVGVVHTYEREDDGLYHWRSSDIDQPEEQQ